MNEPKPHTSGDKSPFSPPHKKKEEEERSLRVSLLYVAFYMVQKGEELVFLLFSLSQNLSGNMAGERVTLALSMIKTALMCRTSLQDTPLYKIRREQLMLSKLPLLTDPLFPPSAHRVL